MSGPNTPNPGHWAAGQDPYPAARARMVHEQLEARGIVQAEVLKAMGLVPRHEFLSSDLGLQAYADSALPIACDQTISQPYIVALMTELLRLKPNDTILEVGTGSGYQAAVLAEMGARVYTLEIVAPLAKQAQDTLQRLGYSDRVQVRSGDGFAGWPEAAPFDGILITCAVSRIPPPLIEQLSPSGRMVLPWGESLSYQTLTVVTKTRDHQLQFENITGVVFVPMTGPHGFGR